MEKYDRFSDPKHIAWAKAVKARDNFECQICGATKVYLHSHHKNSFDYFVDERFDILNGVTLCSSCHLQFHQIYGHGRNTKFQFEEFEKFVNLLRQIAWENHTQMSSEDE